MKFKMQYPTMIYALLGIIIAITTGSLILNIMIIAEIKNLINYNPALTIISLVCSILMFTLCIVVLVNSCYSIKERNFKIVYGIFAIPIQFNKIIVVLEDKTEKKLYLQYFIGDNDDVDNSNYITINIKPKLFDDFIKVLIEKNSNIIHNIVESDEDI